MGITKKNNLIQTTMSKFTIEEMWRVSQRNNSAWGIEGYDVPKKYNDYYRSKRKKELEALKPGKYIKAPDVHFCKRGHYLDFQYKSQTMSVNHGTKKKLFQPGPG